MVLRDVSARTGRTRVAGLALGVGLLAVGAAAAAALYSAHLMPTLAVPILGIGGTVVFYSVKSTRDPRAPTRARRRLDARTRDAAAAVLGRRPDAVAWFAIDTARPGAIGTAVGRLGLRADAGGAARSTRSIVLALGDDRLYVLGAQLQAMTGRPELHPIESHAAGDVRIERSGRGSTVVGMHALSLVIGERPAETIQSPGLFGVEENGEFLDALADASR